MPTTIGIDIGGTRMRAARVSACGNIEAFKATATPRSVETVIAALDLLIASVDGEDASSIGVGVPGRVDSLTGKILSGGFVDLSGVSLGDRLQTRKDRPIVVGNDAGMALVAEAAIGAAAGLKHVVLLTIGTGIGGAVMIDGRIYHGRLGAGQLGHITVNAGGEPCLCGRRGCLETMSSGSALRRLMTARGFAHTDSIEDLLRLRDTAALNVLRDWALPLRAGIDSLVAAFDPERVVLGGGLGAAAVAALTEFPALSPWFQCETVAATCGDEAGVIGAALASISPAP